VLIRDAQEEDWPAIWSFLRVVIATGETLCWQRDEAEEIVRAGWMRTPPGRTVVAVAADGRVVGAAERHPNQRGPGGHVANAGFVTDPAFGGRGIGRRLGEFVIRAAAAEGYRAMQFNAVVETNVGAVRLWRSLGFVVIGTVPAAFDHPVHGPVGLHVMHRSLEGVR
jgi:GNAT superfamily N-acetyltransferase